MATGTQSSASVQIQDDENALIYALTESNNLIQFNSSNPALILSTVALTGTGLSNVLGWHGVDFGDRLIDLALQRKSDRDRTSHTFRSGG